MNSHNLVLIFVIFNISAWANENCTSEDEFLHSILTDEWKTFMDKLNEITFNGNYTKNCINDPSKNVTVNPNSEIIWNLRFKLYDETHNETSFKNCNEKASKGGKCKQTEFANCMKTVRTNMLEELESVRDQINKELDTLTQNC